ncbi:ATP-binding cassette domain-containing protein [Natronorubrum sp. JWXQ-INN-674]|uniref:Nickel import system ATP-binding protein NikD n=1 Tax=Natronorubrum halalkaliphilum TaxID=2691917 RepID=A0A6B0VHG1_9EURY|nr:ABC transporter ATP-binding protein [Natronorubrum halalkaliphilum]MXV60555.1 ATP-binding cassette domain-containing protein [Natronorubrum halalkaliphilum]
MSGDSIAPGERSLPDEDEDEGEESLLEVEDLRTVFYTDKEEIHAVDGIDFSIRKGETLGIVGESGSGKSVTARSIMGLIKSPGRIVGGSIRYRGEDLVGKSETELEGYRGGDIAMIFQDPMTSLNPVYTVGNQIKEALDLHQDLTGEEATDEAARLLESVNIPDARRRLSEYPHEFSGGMRQRALIAMALACDPDLLICDEPTTALDVTTQAQILELLQEIQRERDLAMLFITHDIGVIAEVADRVAVMYAGEIIERAAVKPLFADPKHPYTQGLLESIPGRNPEANQLHTIDGDVPTATEPASSCRFAPRCPAAFDECQKVHPATVSVDDDHTVSCLLYPEADSKTDRLAQHRDTDEVIDE